MYIRDCLGRTFKIAIEKPGMNYLLGSGWGDMLQEIDCGCGDELMLKFKLQRQKNMEGGRILRHNW